jgi:hypothetical protein
MRWVLGLVSIVVLFVGAWQAVGRRGIPGARGAFLLTALLYASPILAAMGMALMVDAGFARSWASTARHVYVSTMMFLTMFGIFCLMLFLQRPRQSRESLRRLERNSAIGSAILTLVIGIVSALTR